MSRHVVFVGRVGEEGIGHVLSCHVMLDTIRHVQIRSDHCK